MATYTSYEKIGAKEDVSDIISNISPTKTPFQAMIGERGVDNKLFQWQEDSLRAVADNRMVEGADATDVTANPTVMRNNVTQILSETVKVSATNDRISAYGRAKETAYQLAKAAKQVKRDLENAFVGTAQALAAGNASTARGMAGVQAQINSGMVTYTGAGPAALSEAKLVTALQTCYTEGAEPDTVMVTPTNAPIVAAFASAAGRYRTIQTGGNDKTIVNAVDLYVSPFGEVRVVLNRFLRALDTFIFEKAQWKKAVLRPWTRETLAKTGDATKTMLVGEFSLQHANQKASAFVREGTTF